MRPLTHLPSAARPHPGEFLTCPKCLRIMQFDERFSFVDGKGLHSDPAWLCLNDACGYQQKLPDFK
jgi:hypothetical protein